MTPGKFPFETENEDTIMHSDDKKEKKPGALEKPEEMVRIWYKRAMWKGAYPLINEIQKAQRGPKQVAFLGCICRRYLMSVSLTFKKLVACLC